MSRVYVLGGRIFSVPEQTTARQDAYMIAQAMEAGVMEFAGKKLDEQTTVNLTTTIFKSGKLEYLLAAGLIEDGVKWTAKAADANADYFGELTDPESKSQILASVVEVLAAFFRGAPLSSSVSPNAGTVEAPSPPASDNGANSTEHEVPELVAVGAV